MEKIFYLKSAHLSVSPTALRARNRVCPSPSPTPRRGHPGEFSAEMHSWTAVVRMACSEKPLGSQFPGENGDRQGVGISRGCRPHLESMCAHGGGVFPYRMRRNGLTCEKIGPRVGRLRGSPNMCEGGEDCAGRLFGWPGPFRIGVAFPCITVATTSHVGGPSGMEEGIRDEGQKWRWSPEIRSGKMHFGTVAGPFWNAPDHQGRKRAIRNGRMKWEMVGPKREW